MILVSGELIENIKQEEVISSLKERIYKTLKTQTPPSVETVINACDALYKKVMNHEYDDIILPLLKSLNIPYSMLDRYASYFSKEGLTKKVEIELGDLVKGKKPLDGSNYYSIAPLGILFHIAAGNVDLLPAYSVIEGLLAGNINILKLPSGDNGLSVKLLKELLDIEPSLKDYIYVFDVPSTEVETIKQLSDLSDATIVWGGDKACKAAREFVDIHSRIIEWSHKISFSYIDKNVTDEELKSLANSICQTNQLLCSSSQGIYVDTDNEEDFAKIAERFISIFGDISKESNTLPFTMKAKNSLTIYNEKLEGRGKGIYQKNGVSVRVLLDNKLETSFLFQDVWVKPLKHENIIDVLKPNKSLIQTVSVNENIANRDKVFELLSKVGAVRIVRLGDNSRMIAGESHDGKYALREYTRIVETYK